MTASHNGTIDPLHFRRALGQFPTGVAVITAESAQDGASGMVVSSFTSVSLDPPLVGFLPAKSSTSWPRIERTGSFCVNVLSADQEAVCRRFASKAPDKFEGQTYELGATGAPKIAGSVARIHCEIDSVIDAGDHLMVFGAVRELELGESEQPLVFYQGGYGRLEASSLAAPDEQGRLTLQLRYLDMMRDEFEALADDLGCRATVTARVGGELVILGHAGRGRTSGGTLVGQKLPNVPSTGSIFAAWDGPSEAAAWLRTTSDEARIDQHRRTLELVRRRGYSLSVDSTEHRAFAAVLHNAAQGYDTSSPKDLTSIVNRLADEPDDLTDDTRVTIRQISAPVFDHDGRVALALTVFGYGRPDPSIDAYIARVQLAAQRSTALIGGIAAGPAAESAGAR